MGEPTKFQHPISEAIRSHAMTFPETNEGSSCVNRAFSAGGKNFLFLGEKPDLCTLRLKLTAGWQKIEFPPDDPPPLEQVEAWITECFFLLAPKKVRALVDP